MNQSTPLVAVLLALLAFTGCQAKAPGDQVRDEREVAREYAQCMREHGVDMSDSGSDTSQEPDVVLPDRKILDEAIEQCRQYAPGGGDTASISPEQLEEMRAFARCMRENGVPDFPDPDPNGQPGFGGGNDSGSGDGKASDATVDNDTKRRAAQKCGQSTSPSPTK